MQERRKSPSRRSPRNGGGSLYADVQVELTEQIFRKLTPTVAIGGATMVGITGVLASHFHDPWLWQLTAFMVLVCGLRLAVVFAFEHRKHRDLTPASAQVWERRHGTMTLLYCCAMSMSTLYNYRFHDQNAWSICTLATFSLCAALGAQLGMRPFFNQLAGIVMLGALALSILAMAPDKLANVAVLLILVFTVVHCSQVSNKFETLVEQLRSRHMLRDLAQRDSLTDLMNRRHFEECLATLCGGATSMAILYIDLDRFKKVNDLHGHATGDLLLKQVAERLQSVIRKTDLLARLGGDEFAILHINATEQTAQSIAGRINAAIAEPFQIEDHLISVGASVGIRLSGPGCQDPQRLLTLADDALYRVKQAGRGSFSFARD